MDLSHILRPWQSPSQKLQLMPFHSGSHAEVSWRACSSCRRGASPVFAEPTTARQDLDARTRAQTTDFEILAQFWGSAHFRMHGYWWTKQPVTEL